MTDLRTDYRERVQYCAECGGSGRRWGFDREIDCFDCDGTGEWDAVCSECSEIAELNDGGICRSCDAALTEPLTELKRTGTGGWL